MSKMKSVKDRLKDEIKFLTEVNDKWTIEVSLCSN